MIAERDVMVPTRDGVRLCVDVFRPDTDEPLPALLAFAIYNKGLQAPDVTGTGRAAPVPVPGRSFRRFPPEQGAAGRTAPRTGRTMTGGACQP
jgi:predicted acyl esterase